MKYYKKIITYAAIGLASACMLGCEVKYQNEQAEKPVTLESKADEASPFWFDKSKITNDHMPNISWSEVLSVTCGDLDGDGDLDIIVATKEGLTIYENKTPQKKLFKQE